MERLFVDDDERLRWVAGDEWKVEFGGGGVTLDLELPSFFSLEEGSERSRGRILPTC